MSVETALTQNLSVETNLVRACSVTVQVTVAKVLEKMKQRAENETTTINAIYRESLHEINQDPELADAAAILPLHYHLSRKKRERLPSLPATQSEVEFGGEWAKTMSGTSA